MKIICLDELFLLNLVIDYFLLLATARVCALPFRRKRFAMGAAAGSLWCCLSLVPVLSFLNAPILRPVLAMTMTLTAFGNTKKLFRCFFAFLGVSALFGGAVYAASLWRGSGISDGPLVHIDMRILVLSFAICWALVSLLFRRSMDNARREYHTVTVEKNGRTATFQALRDTGNGLYDPISGCSAFVAEADALKPLFPETPISVLRGPPADAVTVIPGARLIPCSSIDGKRQLLLAFRPDRVLVDKNEQKDLLAAVSPSPIGTEGTYQAVL